MQSLKVQNNFHPKGSPEKLSPEIASKNAPLFSNVTH
jgi:hypothetical protein